MFKSRKNQCSYIIFLALFLFFQSYYLFHKLLLITFIINYLFMKRFERIDIDKKERFNRK